MSRSLRRITRKTLLYKSAISDGGGYALNHALGCSHGCTYPCYAMLMKKRFGAVGSYEDWTSPKIVGNALELLDNELLKLTGKVGHVFMCLATDAFMYGADEVRELTLNILSRLNVHGVRASVLSKGIFPDVLSTSELYNQDNEYGSTIVSLSEDFRKRFEPYAAPIDQRIAALEKLHDAGLKTWVSMEPYPTPNLVKQDIREILDAVSFVDHVRFGTWNYSRLPSRFEHHREFYDSMAYEVMKFGAATRVGIRAKEGR